MSFRIPFSNFCFIFLAKTTFVFVVFEVFQTKSFGLHLLLYDSGQFIEQFLRVVQVDSGAFGCLIVELLELVKFFVE